MAALLFAFCMVLFKPGAAQTLSNSENWLDFDRNESGGWDQPFDRSFARQWEMEPPKGYPTLSKDNIAPMKAAVKQYADIVARGGWEQLPPIELRVGMTHQAVLYLRRRLEMTGDVREQGGYPQTFDSYMEKAVKNVQIRHGLAPTGFVDKNTIAALNVPASARLRQLRANLVRVTSFASSIDGGKYVVVNLPAAQVEAVQNNQIVSRHSGIVGKIDRPTPILRSHIHEINFNKIWIVPPTVIKEDLVPKGRDMSGKGQDVLGKYGIDAYADHAAYGRGQRIDPRRIDWRSQAPYNYFYVQNPGDENPLGFVKINFHNPHSVYMHDTPSQSLFARNFRAESSGCIRVQNVQQLVAWLLEENGWSQAQVARMKESREKLNVQLKRRVPLFFAYVTSWATPDGMVHFRRDIYRRDGVGGMTASAY